MNRKKAVMAAVMLATLIGNAVAIPLVIPLVLGAAAISGFIGYYFGTKSVNQTYVQELEQRYQQLLTSSKQTNDKNIQQMLLEVYAREIKTSTA